MTLSQPILTHMASARDPFTGFPGHAYRRSEVAVTYPLEQPPILFRFRHRSFRQERLRYGKSFVVPVQHLRCSASALPRSST